jgi:2-polyprenyl-3-methyl-5-hydroxy-6-metoxy-1,4-benzoquinol methylase
MRTFSVPCCPACGADGRVVHNALADRLFFAPGKWSFRRCEKRRCSTLWLDPAPHPDDLHLAYQNYYTHSTTPHELAGLLNDRRHRGYASLRLGYPPKIWGNFRHGLKILHRPREIERAQFFRFYLPWRPGGGRVLDVGCGAGNELVLLNQLGWQAEGLDPDPRAVEAATIAGLRVKQGDLFSHSYSENTFDAVTMSHVIEHLIDVPGHLNAAYRLLKHGGHHPKLTLLWSSPLWARLAWTRTTAALANIQPSFTEKYCNQVQISNRTRSH